MVGHLHFSDRQGVLSRKLMSALKTSATESPRAEGIAIFAFTLMLQWVRLAQIGVEDGFGFDYDPLLFEKYARLWVHIRRPYIDFHIEYPPGALLVFTPPVWFGQWLDYRRGFALMMSLITAALATMLWSYMRQNGASRGRQAGALLTLYAAGFYVMHLSHRRFDLVPSVLLGAALLVPSAFLCGLFLGLAILVKLWPLIASPLVLLYTYNKRGREAALKLATGLIIAVYGIPIFMLGTNLMHMFDFLAYHGERGIEITSVWALPAYAAEAMGHYRVETTFNFGADHLVTTPFTRILQSISTKCLLALTSLPILVAAWRWRRGSLGRGDVLALTVAMVCGLLLGSKVFSPQYVLWLVPLASLALAHGSWSRAILSALLAIAVCVATQQIFPYHFDALRDGPRLIPALWGLLRFACLLALYITMLTFREEKSHATN